MTKAPFSIRARIESFGPALRGIAQTIRVEHNAWIHALATLLAVSLGILLEIDRGEWLAIIIVIGMVWAAEAMNTAIELLADALTTETHPKIRDAKDAAAGAVLVCATCALVVGGLILGRRIALLLL